MKRKRLKRIADVLMMIGLFGGMFTAGSLSFGFLFSFIGLTGCALDSLSARIRRQIIKGVCNCERF